jgi:hypothetical protein
VRMNIAAVAFSLAALAGAQVAPQPTVPAGVVFKPASRELNDAVYRRLLGVFAKGGLGFASPNLFAESVICGPALWKRLAAEPGMASPGGAPVNFILMAKGGSYGTLVGRSFEAKDQEPFRAALGRAFPADSDLVIRAPSAVELNRYWGLIAYDIEGPVFVLEARGRAVFMDFAGKQEVFFVDDLAGYVETPDKPGA